jgi:hypothetical protein
MNHAACLFVLLCCVADAGAQSPAPAERGAYLSAELGNGRIHGDGASGERGMRRRAFEARIGRDLNPALLGADPLSRARSTLRIDFVYANEGHPDNNHRDGFAFQLAYARRLADGLTAELAAGPYTSMNTTRINGVELDDARWGILYSAALRLPLPGFDPGTHVRIGVGHVAMRDTFQSNSLMLGIGRHITDVPPFPDTGPARERLWLGASSGRAFTSHTGTQDANGATLEAKQYGGKWAVSFKAVVEGDDRTRVDRRGVAAQFWFVQPLTERWAASAGFGPYLAENRRENNRTGTHGLITLQFERNLGARNKAFFAFHRVKTFNQMNDRDLFHLGLLHGFRG